MRLVFMGTPDFAVQSLEKLHRSHHQIAKVVTVPDRQVGRGRKIGMSPVKEYALKHDLGLLQPEDLKDPDFISTLSALNADLFVVVAFRILSERVFTIPPTGTINLHGSLLPEYRGAAPINWAIINGDKQTGVSTIFIKKAVDAGDLLLQKKVSIGDDETAGELHDRLAITGADLLLETIDQIDNGLAVASRQSNQVTKAPKLDKILARIDWTLSAERINNLVRGLSPTPGAFSKLNNQIIKIFKSATLPEIEGKQYTPGEIIELSARDGVFHVGTGSGLLAVKNLQAQGKKQMDVKDYLLGSKVNAGDRFEV